MVEFSPLWPGLEKGRKVKFSPLWPGLEKGRKERPVLEKYPRPEERREPRGAERKPCQIFSVKTIFFTVTLI